MKRKIGILLMCIVFAMSLALFTACQPAVVDTSGNYEKSDFETVSKKLENKDVALPENGLFKVYEKLMVESKEGENTSNANVELTALMDIVKLNALGDIAVTTTENGKNVEETLGNMKTKFVMDGTNLYITLDGEKVYMPIGSSEAGDITSALEYLEQLLGEINISAGSSNTKYFVYEKGDTLKVKMLEESSRTYGELEQYIKAELFIVFENNAISGVAVNMEMKFSNGEDYSNLKIEMQLGVTDEKLELPDVSDYKPYQG